MQADPVNISQEIIIKGLVQGVGFRPFIYRIANRLGIKGWVENRNDAVYILVQGPRETLELFVTSINEEKPAISHIHELRVADSEPADFQDFQIRWSRNEGDEVTEISPDIAVCDQCLEDMRSQPRRIRYPFTNCTNCGPRFTIIRDVPYDRIHTTMNGFKMCRDCELEYEDISDRRFHAQPVACSHCGPSYELIYKGSRLKETESIINKFSEIINDGGVIMAKGLGGFFLACDAGNENSVSRLRNTKKRYAKPFAVMFRDLESLKPYAEISEAEKTALTSWQRPVVILKSRKVLAPSVSQGFPTVGVLLPYLPIHYLMFDAVRTPALVFTSGNFSEEPILIDDEKACLEFGDKLDAILINDRPIYNRADDSVGQVINGSLRLLRRARGYVPSPVFLTQPAEGLIAAGAELVNCFCVGKDNRAILSQHIGDLKNYETLEFYEESFSRFMHLFRVEPKAVACDLHPDYLSTKYSHSLGIPVLEVQHHHAHIASCMAENGLDEEVIGISMDGTGLGTDGHIWGSEFMRCTLEGFERITHFEYKPMPGGDLAVEKPWRMAVSFLSSIPGVDLKRSGFSFLDRIPEDELEWVLTAISKKINSPLTCGAGRLFDAVAVMLGILTESQFHAEAPMRLEAVASRNVSDYYPLEFKDTLRFDPTLLAILDDLKKGRDVSGISARFHNTVIQAMVEVSGKMRDSSGITDIVISGGLFQNKYILTRLESRLKEINFNVFSHRNIPCNDGGIALGQLAILAKKRKSLCV